MKAGRYLDKLIATHVTQFKGEVIPPYSTDMKYAWEVLLLINKISQNMRHANEDYHYFQSFRIENHMGYWYVGPTVDVFCEEESFIDDFTSESHSAEHAICLCALKMVNYKKGRNVK